MASKKNQRTPSLKAPIPNFTAIESDMPVEFMHELALKEGNGKKPIYQIHKWWARRLGTCFRMLLLGATTSAKRKSVLFNGGFYKENKIANWVVLDPFLGGGTSLVESTKLGANFIGVDIDPVACLISKKEIEPTDEKLLVDAFEEIKFKCEKKIKARYSTTLANGEKAEIVNAFWVDILTCLECGIKREAHTHYRLAHDTHNMRQTVFCESCHQIANIHLNFKTFTCKACNHRTHIDKGTTTSGILNCYDCGASTPILNMVHKGTPLPRTLFAMEVIVDGGTSTTFVEARNTDWNRYKKTQKEFNRKRLNLIFPKVKIPKEGRNDNRPIIHGFDTYASLFNNRQLLCLSEIAKAISKIKSKRTREYLALAFSDCLASNNMLCAYAFGYKKLTPLFGIHGYRKILRPVENNVWGTFRGRGSFVKCFQKLLKGKKYSKSPFEIFYSSNQLKHIYTGETAESRVVSNFKQLSSKHGQSAFILNNSSENLSKVPAKSVDLILTDPPYFNNIHYSEMSDFYHVWLRQTIGPSYIGFKNKHTPFVDSLYPSKFIPGIAENGVSIFRKKLTVVFGECRRVIKSNGMLIFTHHHKSLLAWQNLAIAVLLNKFVVKNVFPVRSEGRGGFHSSEGNLKWDAVVVARPINKLEKRKKQIGPIKKRVLYQVQYWVRRLKSSNILLSNSDLISLSRAFLLKEFSGIKWTEDNLMEKMKEADPIHFLLKK